jgi:heme/copper-type cytochrome/quinol oxidase subunit 3
MRRFNTVKLATAFFLASEAVFFTFLIAQFVFFRANVHGTQYGTTPLNPPRTLIFTICLLASSGTIWIAERRLEAAQPAGFRFWMMVTIALGAVFIAGQAWEYAGLLSKLVTPERDLFGASFFTLTGFHGFHVICGLIALSVVLMMAFKRDLGAREIAGVGAVSMYWHFVDVVWIVIFSLVYLSVWI